jgi:hypothetical protein
VSLEEFFEVAEIDIGGWEQGGEASLSGLDPGSEGVLRNKVGVDNIRYHIYDT